jgi:hypothetical protein
MDAAVRTTSAVGGTCARVRRAVGTCCLSVLLARTQPSCLLVGYEPMSPSAELDAGAAPPREVMDAGIDGAPEDAREDQAPKDTGADGDARDSALADASSDATTDGARADAGDAGAIGDGGPACDAAVNPCGGCAVLAHAPGLACGTCGLGSYVCSGSDAVVCMGGDARPSASGGTVLIDDFEDGDGKVNPASGLSGTWYTLSDGTAGILTPAVGTTVLPSSGGAQGSTRAVHVTGRGFTSWGAGLAGSLSAYQCAYDGAAERGLSFYAKGTGSLRIALATTKTVRASQGGLCTTGCDDHFNAAVTLAAGWQLYTITFASLKQAGFGTATTFSATQLMYVQFYYGPNATFDFWIDNVSFY